jgi:hypothetical protein
VSILADNLLGSKYYLVRVTKSLNQLTIKISPSRLKKIKLTRQPTKRHYIFRRSGFEGKKYYRSVRLKEEAYKL